MCSKKAKYAVESKEEFPDFWRFVDNNISQDSIGQEGLFYGENPQLEHVKNSAREIFGAMIDYAIERFPREEWVTSNKNAKRFAFVMLMSNLQAREKLLDKNINEIFRFEDDVSVATKKQTTVKGTNEYIEAGTSIFMLLQHAFAQGEDMHCFFNEFDTDKSWSNLAENILQKLSSVVIFGDISVCEAALGIWNKRYRNPLSDATHSACMNLIKQSFDNDVVSAHCEHGRTQLFNYVFKHISKQKMNELSRDVKEYIKQYSLTNTLIFVQRLLSESNPIKPTGLFLQFLKNETWSSHMTVDDLGEECDTTKTCEITNENGKITKKVCPENAYLCDGYDEDE